MVVLIFALGAMAEPFDLSEWEPVQPLDTLEGGLLDGEQGWLRTEAGCVQAVLDRTGGPRLEVPLCEAGFDGIELACVAGTRVGPEWSIPALSCQWERPDGSGGGWMSTHGSSSHDRPVLVEHDAEHAVWRSVGRLAAEPAQHRRVVNPCTRKSLRKISNKGADGGERTCDTSAGLQHYLVPVGHGRGHGVATLREDKAVDCTQPCPPNPDIEAVRAENARLEGQVFAHRDGKRMVLHATEAACEADTETKPVWLPEADADCDPDPRPWLESESGG